MLILISPEHDVLNEISLLNEMFRAGLEVFHLRKPNKSKEEYRLYIKAIKPEYHNRIVLHQHHDLMNEFNLKGIHFTESKRLNLKPQETNNQQPTTNNQFSITISSSFHSKKEIIDCKIDFDYIFLSPVFNSISKSDYLGKEFDISDSDINIVALGGINENNMGNAFKLGYKNIAVLGSVWDSHKPVQQFKILWNLYKSIK